jgi:hypothetical protein
VMCWKMKLPFTTLMNAGASGNDGRSFACPRGNQFVDRHGPGLAVKPKAIGRQCLHHGPDLFLTLRLPGLCDDIVPILSPPIRSRDLIELDVISPLNPHAKGT